MPNNRKVVEQRLKFLKLKLQKNSTFYSEYKTFMNELFVKGYAEKVHEEELNRGDGKVWYIPHHGVYHPIKKRLRVVFDCGATYQGTSLNAQLLQGPDLTSSLIGVVTRFRKEPVVMMADVESMFHQVRVTPEDSDLLRFLWWQDGDLEQEPAVYRMRVHLFGATSSPSCANFALRKCAEDFGICTVRTQMELIAATMASRMDVLWKRELQMDLLESVFWTDSESVLKYIQNETSRYKVFVANRVAQILKVSKAAQWRYVDTACNPADIASRGAKVEALLKPLHGCQGLTSCCVQRVSGPIVHHWSAFFLPKTQSWTSLRKSVAWILRIKEWLMGCARKRKELKLAMAKSDLAKEQQEHIMEDKMQTFRRTKVTGNLTVEDVQKAELAIVKYCQLKNYAEELDSLEKGQPVKRTSHLRKLNPQLQNGVIRVGGRLSNLSMPVETKHSVILPKDLHVSELLLRHIHQEVGHGGRNHMLSKLRERYWITGASTAIRKVLSRCIICRRMNALPAQQKMADLPSERIVPDEPPFTRVGVDCFGPFEVKSRRSMVKRYGVIFTCLAIRAVHIEIAMSLETDSFINALRRFIARRGQVRELRSDNGTNFTGAERELKIAIEQWNQAHIGDVMLQRGIKWNFNPPAGSHHGGAWERLIRSVRKVLNSTLRVQNLDEEGLHTVLCEAEAILNSRPITKASLDVNDLEALTPNHLLLLKTSPSLPPGVFEPNDMYANRRWKQVQYMSDLFWKRWVKEYLPQLQERQRWNSVKRNFSVGDLVLIMDSAAPRNSWTMGRVTHTFPDNKGFVRQVRIKTRSSYLDRPITKICLLQEAEAD
ncbi:hypothetical protein WMY93_009592 [Mugilogobius chulae]|uniref:Integrase catalytic domain-containing protein n=1 Tax=Mugilogobius chulae TaxID=88201 RepID=A0AAW0PFM4_9GOBI